MSKFARTTSLKSAGGYSATCTKVSIGPSKPVSPTGRFVIWRRVTSIMISGYRYTYASMPIA